MTKWQHVCNFGLVQACIPRVPCIFRGHLHIRLGAWPDLSGQGSSLSGRTTPTLSIMQYVRRASD